MTRLRRPLTPGRPGKYGMLYLYRITYDLGGRPEPWHCWAYDAQQAQDKWNDGNIDEGFEQLTDPVRV